jgi:hypothetical protein
MPPNDRMAQMMQMFATMASIRNQREDNRLRREQLAQQAAQFEQTMAATGAQVKQGQFQKLVDRMLAGSDEEAQAYAELAQSSGFKPEELQAIQRIAQSRTLSMEQQRAQAVQRGMQQMQNVGGGAAGAGMQAMAAAMPSAMGGMAAGQRASQIAGDPRAVMDVAAAYAANTGQTPLGAQVGASQIQQGLVPQMAHLGSGIPQFQAAREDAARQAEVQRQQLNLSRTQLHQQYEIDKARADLQRLQGTTLQPGQMVDLMGTARSYMDMLVKGNPTKPAQKLIIMQLNSIAAVLGNPDLIVNPNDPEGFPSRYPAWRRMLQTHGYSIEGVGMPQRPAQPTMQQPALPAFGNLPAYQVPPPPPPPQWPFR